MPTPEELQAEVDSFLWFHKIDLGNGVRTKGLSDLAYGPELFPSFEGRSVLDIGAWDGRYSFMAEQGGASRVVAMDHYAWGVDMHARNVYWEECRQKGTLPDQRRDTTDFWHDDLPWQRGFRTAKRILDSKVEPLVQDFYTSDLGPVGTFDVVLFLGVLYHIKDPLLALEKVRSLCTEVAVIESVATDIPGHEDESLCRFLFNGDYGSGTDFGNWWVPSRRALEDMCLAAGFSRVDVVQGPPPRPSAPPAPSLSDRLRHAARGDIPPAPAPGAADYRIIAHAWV